MNEDAAERLIASIADTSGPSGLDPRIEIGIHNLTPGAISMLMLVGLDHPDALVAIGSEKLGMAEIPLRSIAFRLREEMDRRQAKIAAGQGRGT